MGSKFRLFVLICCFLGFLTWTGFAESRSYEGSCPPGSVSGCYEQQNICFDESWIGDGVCDSEQPNLCCYESEIADCQDGECANNDAGCSDGEVTDCSGLGKCAPAFWIGDGFCDGINEEIDLCCYEFDGGDCSDSECGSTEVKCKEGTLLDCASNENECWPSNWVGDGYCDGTEQVYDANFCCYELDGGDCSQEECFDNSGSNCAPDEVSDCLTADDCWPASWLGDGFCDGYNSIWESNLCCYKEEETDCENTIDCTPPPLGICCFDQAGCQLEVFEEYCEDEGGTWIEDINNELDCTSCFFRSPPEPRIRERITLSSSVSPDLFQAQSNFMAADGNTLGILDTTLGELNIYRSGSSIDGADGIWSLEQIFSIPDIALNIGGRGFGGSSNYIKISGSWMVVYAAQTQKLHAFYNVCSFLGECDTNDDYWAYDTTHDWKASEAGGAPPALGGDMVIGWLRLNDPNSQNNGDDSDNNICPEGFVEDCTNSNECVPNDWIGDGYCDGFNSEEGTNLCCYQGDGGDCPPNECATKALKNFRNSKNAIQILDLLLGQSYIYFPDIEITNPGWGLAVSDHWILAGDWENDTTGRALVLSHEYGENITYVQDLKPPLEKDIPGMYFGDSIRIHGDLKNATAIVSGSGDWSTIPGFFSYFKVNENNLWIEGNPHTFEPTIDEGLRFGSDMVFDGQNVFVATTITQEYEGFDLGDYKVEGNVVDRIKVGGMANTWTRVGRFKRKSFNETESLFGFRNMGIANTQFIAGDIEFDIFNESQGPKTTVFLYGKNESYWLNHQGGPLPFQAQWSDGFWDQNANNSAFKKHIFALQKGAYTIDCLGSSGTEADVIEILGDDVTFNQDGKIDTKVMVIRSTKESAGALTTNGEISSNKFVVGISEGGTGLGGQLLLKGNAKINTRIFRTLPGSTTTIELNNLNKNSLPIINAEQSDLSGALQVTLKSNNAKPGDEWTLIQSNSIDPINNSFDGYLLPDLEYQNTLLRIDLIPSYENGEYVLKAIARRNSQGDINFKKIKEVILEGRLADISIGDLGSDTDSHPDGASEIVLLAEGHPGKMFIIGDREPNARNNIDLGLLFAMPLTGYNPFGRNEKSRNNFIPINPTSGSIGDTDGDGDNDFIFVGQGYNPFGRSFTSAGFGGFIQGGGYNPFGRSKGSSWSTRFSPSESTFNTTESNPVDVELVDVDGDGISEAIIACTGSAPDVNTQRSFGSSFWSGGVDAWSSGYNPFGQRGDEIPTQFNNGQLLASGFAPSSIAVGQGYNPFGRGGTYTAPPFAFGSQGLGTIGIGSGYNPFSRNSGIDSSLELGSGISDIEYYDINGDQNPDMIAVGRSTGTVSIINSEVDGRGRASFGDQFTIPFDEPIDAKPLTLKDGRLGLAVVTPDGVQILFSRNESPGRGGIFCWSFGGSAGYNPFGARNDSELSYEPSAVHVVDFDGDGSDELIIVQEEGPETVLSVFSQVQENICGTDINGDGTVGALDLLLVISEFLCTENCTADINEDGIVNIIDLVEIINTFGPC